MNKVKKVDPVKYSSFLFFKLWSSFQWRFDQTANAPGPCSTRWRSVCRFRWPGKKGPGPPTPRWTASSGPSSGSCSSSPFWTLSRSPSQCHPLLQRWWPGQGWSTGNRWSWTLSRLASGMAPCVNKWQSQGLGWFNFFFFRTAETDWLRLDQK